MRILGIIPARGGSKGVPNKNVKLLNGKPLLQYTTDVALQCNGLSKVILSSDDDKIIKVAKDLGIEVPFIRPNNLAQDASPTLPVILHALEFFDKQGESFDAVCLLQVTSPFRTVDFLDKAIEKFIKQDSDSLISVLEVPHEFNPHWVFEVNKIGELKIATGEKDIISRRQELPKSYHRDGCIYITKTAVLKEQKSLFGQKISYIESSQKHHVNIDTMDDWRRAEEMIIKYN